ncbi:MAG: zf-HC2 domain-containing protein [Caldilineae bacterium]|nr:zf-HC2 domain-containing protein [Caldilineae bacterium]
MTCARIRRLIGVYRELDRPERRMLAEHLQGCESCRLAWRAEQQVLARLRSIPVLDPPAGLEPQLLRIPSLAAPRPRGWLLPRMLPLALLALGGLLTLGDGWRPATPADRAAPAALDGPGDADRLAAADPSAAHPASLAASPAARPVDRQVRYALRTPEAARLAEIQAPPAGRAAGGTRLPTLRPRGVTGPRGGDNDPFGDAGGGANKPQQPDPGEPKAPRPSPAPSQTPAPAEDPAPACVDLTLRIFADCLDCDGQPGPGSSQALPEGMQFSVYDSSPQALTEGLIEARGETAISLHLGPLCGRLPLQVTLLQIDPLWLACPSLGGASRRIDTAGPASLDFGLGHSCPAATAAPEPAEPTPGAGEPSPTPPPETPPPSTPPGPAVTAPAQQPAELTPAAASPSPSPTDTPTPGGGGPSLEPPPLTEPPGRGRSERPGS